MSGFVEKNVITTIRSGWLTRIKIYDILSLGKLNTPINGRTVYMR